MQTLDLEKENIGCWYGNGTPHNSLGLNIGIDK